jgi:hypothetical protein
MILHALGPRENAQSVREANRRTAPMSCGQSIDYGPREAVNKPRRSRLNAATAFESLTAI